MLKKITESPYLNLLSGLILLVTSAYETITSLGEASLGAHHGVLVFSIIQLAKVIPEINRGLGEIQEANEVFENR